MRVCVRARVRARAYYPLPHALGLKACVCVLELRIETQVQKNRIARALSHAHDTRHSHGHRHARAGAQTHTHTQHTHIRSYAQAPSWSGADCFVRFWTPDAQRKCAHRPGLQCTSHVYAMLAVYFPCTERAQRTRLARFIGDWRGNAAALHVWARSVGTVCSSMCMHAQSKRARVILPLLMSGSVSSVACAPWLGPS